jgi:hypothetical protein
MSTPPEQSLETSGPLPSTGARGSLRLHVLVQSTRFVDISYQSILPDREDPIYTWTERQSQGSVGIAQLSAISLPCVRITCALPSYD